MGGKIKENLRSRSTGCSEKEGGRQRGGREEAYHTPSTLYLINKVGEPFTENGDDGSTL